MEVFQGHGREVAGVSEGEGQNQGPQIKKRDGHWEIDKLESPNEEKITNTCSDLSHRDTSKQSKMNIYFEKQTKRDQIILKVAPLQYTYCLS